MSVELRHINFSYQETPVLCNVSFSAPTGQITVLLGASGAGKTSCLRLLAGLEIPASGEVLIHGTSVSSSSHWVPPRERSVGYCFQESALWTYLTVQQHISIPLRAHSKDPNFIQTRTEEILKNFNIQALAKRYPDQLSGGEQKRLSFARALASNPQVMLLDEPLSNVEGAMREELIRLIHTLKNSQRTILIVTHQIEEALQLADHLVILMTTPFSKGTSAGGYFYPVNRDSASAGVSEFLPVRSAASDSLLHLRI